MDKNLKKFLVLSVILIVIIFLLITVLGYIYRHFTIHVYNLILLILILVIFILNLAIISAVITVFFAYKKKYVKAPFTGLIKVSLNILMPFVAFIGGFSKDNKDVLRKLYIDVNNIIVKSEELKYSPEEVLLLLPHCLQEAGCSYKITRDIKNCRQCGKCCIGDISRLAEKTGVITAVVTGGTVARQLVEECKPKVILSVACERDLTSGISDVKGIPVIGIINKRPNGPCYNTTVDIEKIEEEINKIVTQQTKIRKGIQRHKKHTKTAKRSNGY